MDPWFLSVALTQRRCMTREVNDRVLAFSHSFGVGSEPVTFGGDEAGVGEGLGDRIPGLYSQLPLGNQKSTLHPLKAAPLTRNMPLVISHHAPHLGTSEIQEHQL